MRAGPGGDPVRRGARCGGRGWAGPRASPSWVPAPTRRSGLQLSAASLGKLVSWGPERARMVPCVSVPPPRGPTSRVQPTLFCVLLRARRIGLELAGGGRGGRSEGSGDRGQRVCCPPAPRAPAPPRRPWGAVQGPRPPSLASGDAFPPVFIFRPPALFSQPSLCGVPRWDQQAGLSPRNRPAQVRPPPAAEDSWKRVGFG